MSRADVVALANTLREQALLEPAQLEAVRFQLQADFEEPQALTAELERRGWLTAYQARLVLHGRAAELILGSYVLLEQLGEGGMGQVFKARQRKLGRIVALKVVRAERLGSSDALDRFRREMRAAANAVSPQRSPHLLRRRGQGGAIISPWNCSRAPTWLSSFKTNGPLPFAAACNCIRQAALGLQHAHERGLVHRDVKPQTCC